MKKTLLSKILMVGIGVLMFQSCKKVYDCPSLSLNVGDPCTAANGQKGVVDSACNCYVKPASGGGGTVTYSCPTIKKNYGDSCITNGQAGKIDSNCNCKTVSSGGGSISYSCPSIKKNYGDPCTLNGQAGKIDSNCNCFVINSSGGSGSGSGNGGTKKFCSNLSLYVGDSCLKTGGGFGIVDSSCVCK